MSKSKKIGLGILTFVPLFFMLACLVVFSFSSSSLFVEEHIVSNHPFSPFFYENKVWIIAVIIVSVVISICLLVFYLVHVSKNNRLNSNQKLIWILLLLLSNTLTSVVYYFMYIHTEKNKPLPV